MLPCQTQSSVCHRQPLFSSDSKKRKSKITVASADTAYCRHSPPLVHRLLPPFAATRGHHPLPPPLNATPRRLLPPPPIRLPYLTPYLPPATATLLLLLTTTVQRIARGAKEGHGARLANPARPPLPDRLPRPPGEEARPCPWSRSKRERR